MYEKEFAQRLVELREQKNVSARDMSLSIGRNAGYICDIETSHSLPSMKAFFYMCEYLGVTPYEYFDTDVKAPTKLRELNGYLRHLNPVQLDHITDLVKDLLNISQIGRDNQ